MRIFCGKKKKVEGASTSFFVPVLRGTETCAFSNERKKSGETKVVSHYRLDGGSVSSSSSGEARNRFDLLLLFFFWGGGPSLYPTPLFSSDQGRGTFFGGETMSGLYTQILKMTWKQKSLLVPLLFLCVKRVKRFVCFCE